MHSVHRSESSTRIPRSLMIVSESFALSLLSYHHFLRTSFTFNFWRLLHNRNRCWGGEGLCHDHIFRRISVSQFLCATSAMPFPYRLLPQTLRRRLSVQTFSPHDKHWSSSIFVRPLPSHDSFTMDSTRLCSYLRLQCPSDRNKLDVLLNSRTCPGKCQGKHLNSV